MKIKIHNKARHMMLHFMLEHWCFVLIGFKLSVHAFENRWENSVSEIIKVKCLCPLCSFACWLAILPS
jgi:hypothetical protein